MSYRFVKVTTYYREFVNEHYARHPELVHSSYENQLQSLLDQGFFFADFYKKSFEKIGVEAFELINNAPVLQKQWAKENGSTASGDQVIVEQLKQLQPEVVMFQNSPYFNGAFIDHVRKSVPSIKLVIGFLCSPWPDEMIPKFETYDFVICCSKEFVDKIENSGIKSYLIQHAFDKSILDKIGNSNSVEHDFSFIGSIMPGAGFHDKRRILIESIINSGIDFTLYGNIHTFSKFTVMMQQVAYLLAHGLKGIGLEAIANKQSRLRKGLALRSFPRQLKVSSQLMNQVLPSVYGLEMYRTLAKSKMNLNIHVDIAGAYAANMRLFEVTGVGSCLLTDWKKNIPEMFEDGKEVVTYKSPEECIEKAKYLLSHPEEMKKIALAGQQRTLKDHSYDNRIVRLDEIIRKELGQ